MHNITSSGIQAERTAGSPPPTTTTTTTTAAAAAVHPSPLCLYSSGETKGSEREAPQIKAV